MNDERQPDDEEPLAMKRADEAMYIQEAAEVPEAPSDVVEPVRVLGIVDEDATADRPVAGVLLRLMAAALALLAVGALFYPALHDLVDSEGESVALPAPPPPKPGDTVQVVMLVDSKPPGASVTVADVDRGETPAVFNIACRVGGAVPTRVALAGYRAVTEDVICAAGDPAGLRLKVRLRRK